MPTRRGRIFPPQLVTGLAISVAGAAQPAAVPAATAEEEEPAEKDAAAVARAAVVYDMALLLRAALSRKGRAPFGLSGRPMFDDLCALRDTLAECLQIAEDGTLRQWHTVLEHTLPAYQPAFDEIQRARDWLQEIHEILDVPPPTTDKPGAGSPAVAAKLQKYLDKLAGAAELSPWLIQFRDALLALSQRYWSGLFHCYDIVGLPRTNNQHEQRYGQVKRQLRRQSGLSDLRRFLLRRGAWAIFQSTAASPAKLQEQLAKVSLEDYCAERAGYEQRQAQLRYRYHWRHQRATLLQQLRTAWTTAALNC